MYYTYVLKSTKDTDFYTGFTNDLKLRFEQHNKGLVESTKQRRPFTSSTTRHALIRTMQREERSI